MRKTRHTKAKIEFGDFQTPLSLTTEICRLLAGMGLRPATVVEPTCGTGNFILSSIETFPAVRRAFGLDINPERVSRAESHLRDGGASTCLVEVKQGDFFSHDWHGILADLPDPLLVIGNPPWVTNAEVGSLGGHNLPRKSNFHNRRGLDAITGSSNFDISEYILLQAVDWIADRQGAMAMLCKTTVARKILLHTWKERQNVACDMFLVDAEKYFGASVGACLLVLRVAPAENGCGCRVHKTLHQGDLSSMIGYEDGCLVADLRAFHRWEHLRGRSAYRWRSGIKHDCARVMELTEKDGRHVNGFGESVELEPDYLYPMLKSSDIAGTRVRSPSRWMLVTQSHPAEDTRHIKTVAPKTWRYLERYADLFDARRSSIYRNRPRFSVFGVGEYSFSPWKVAASGFYKKLAFVPVAPHDGRPVVFDDTCYFIPCQSLEESLFLARLLNSEVARDFFSAYVFWDEKRPISVRILNRLDLVALARELGQEPQLDQLLGKHHGTPRALSLFG